MKTRKIFQSALIGVLAWLLIVGMATAVRADGPWPWGQNFPWSSSTPWPTPYVLSVGERFSLGVVIFPATPTPALLNIVAPSVKSSVRPPSDFAPAPAVTTRGGDSPANALSADGVTRSLAAGASVWYKIGNGGEHIEASLDANPLSGMSLTVFAPGNMSDPIGQGTISKNTGRLVWAGGHWNSEGTWLARVSNSNPMTVQYTLTTSANKIPNKSCYSYWENLPTGQRIYWTECEK